MDEALLGLNIPQRIGRTISNAENKNKSSLALGVNYYLCEHFVRHKKPKEKTSTERSKPMQIKIPWFLPGFCFPYLLTSSLLKVLKIS